MAAYGVMTWWAAYCEPNREGLAAESLRALGLEVFYPHEQVKKRVCLRQGLRYVIRDVELPVFPRYLFVDGESAPLVRMARGVICVVGGPEGPVRVSERVIARMRSVGDEAGVMRSRDVSTLRLELGWAVGDMMRIWDRDPAFGGHQVVIRSLARLEEKLEVVVETSLFGRVTPIHVNYKTLIPMGPPKTVAGPIAALATA